MDMSHSRTVTCLNGTWDFKSATSDQWCQIPVPGCYSEYREGKWRKDYWDGFGYPHEWSRKGAQYKRIITLSRAQLSRPLQFVCEGCYHVYRVLLNGQEVAASGDGYTPTVCELNDAAKEGENLLEVIIDESKGELSGGESSASYGIWHDTYLVSHAKQYINGNPHIITSVSKGELSCNIDLSNVAGADSLCSVMIVVEDADGKIVKQSEQADVSLVSGQLASVSLSTPWADARQWFPHDPYLYTMRVLLLDNNGQVIDHWQDQFGFREVTVDGHRMYINGQELYLRGHGGHYLGDLQASKEYHLNWLGEMKKLGVNFIRLHIYPKHRTLYRAADELGIMLMGEPAFHFSVPEATEELREFSKKHLGDMIDHLRNHPSIIMWSVSNELRWRGGGEKPWLVDHAKMKDSTRPSFSSDFSAFSTYGDLIGHHYNTDTVFTEWEEHGPDKPMIWDECGEVWHPTRPLGNGSAGYETASQDYATGTYRDGQEEIARAMDLIREGKEFAGALHRINGVIPWDLGYVFFRWQPYNRFRGVALPPAREGDWGVQPRQVLPCSSALNIWDPTLPVYEPNPAFYLFEEDIKVVRFHHEPKSRTFFAGTQVQVETPLLIYDDLRQADAVHCIVEDEDGNILTERTQPIDCVPGQLYRDVTWTFDAPHVAQATRVRLVRHFEYAGVPGYRDQRDAMVYPAIDATGLGVSGKLAVHDPEGSLAKQLQVMGATFERVESLASLASPINVLITTAEDSSALQQSIADGLRVIQLMPASANYAEASTATKLLNGPVYSVLQGLPQEALTFWRNGPVHGGMERIDQAVNSRMVLAADRDCQTAALDEQYIGKGLLIRTSLRVADSLKTEPAAHKVLGNLVSRALSYSPSESSKKVAYYGSDVWTAFIKQTGVVADELASLDTNASVNYDVLLLDADSAAGHQEVLQNLASSGLTIFVQGVTDQSISTFSGAADLELTLTEPFLDERRHCVKAATSWTLRNTPKDGVEYFRGVVIPQPFEPNYDTLLAGICNADLRSPVGEAVFEKGIKPAALNAVGYNERANMLVSNWRIDWSVPPAGGEYISVGKDIRRAQWFLNRDAVLLRVARGSTTFLFCQLKLMEMEDNGVRVMRQLLTNMGCPLGAKTCMEPEEHTYDLSVIADQKARLARNEAVLATLKPLPELPEIFSEITGDGSGGEQRKVLLLLDQSMKKIGANITDRIADFSITSVSPSDYDNIDDMIDKLTREAWPSGWDIIYFTIGEVPDGEEHKESLHKLVKILKARGSQLMWGTIPPVAAADADQSSNAAIVAFNEYARTVMQENDIYVNDSYEYCQSHFGDYVWGEAADLGDPKAGAFALSIAEAIKFFGN